MSGRNSPKNDSSEQRSQDRNSAKNNSSQQRSEGESSAAISETFNASYAETLKVTDYKNTSSRPQKKASRGIFDTCSAGCGAEPGWENVVQTHTEENNFNGNGSWSWDQNGKLTLTCQQPLIHVPVVQEIHRRDRIIEVPKMDVVDLIQPVTYNQYWTHEVPKIKVMSEKREIEIPFIKVIEREVIVPIVTGYTHKFIPKWEVREVPRPVVKYVGEQEIVSVDIPQVQYVDRVVEKEVVVDTVEKKVPKVVEQIEEVDSVKYVWKPVEKIIYVERYVPKYNVNLECPAPLLVPYTVTKVKELPPAVFKMQPRQMQDSQGHCEAPADTIRVSQDYVDHYSKTNSSMAVQCGTTLRDVKAMQCCSNLCPGTEEQQLYAQSGEHEFLSMSAQEEQNTLHETLLERYEETHSSRPSANSDSHNPIH